MLSLYRLQIVKLNNNNNHKFYSSIAYNNSKNAGSQNRYIHTQNIEQIRNELERGPTRGRESYRVLVQVEQVLERVSAVFQLGEGGSPHREILHIGNSFLAGGSLVG